MNHEPDPYFQSETTARILSGVLYEQTTTDDNTETSFLWFSTPLLKMASNKYTFVLTFVKVDFFFKFYLSVLYSKALSNPAAHA